MSVTRESDVVAKLAHRSYHGTQILGTSTEAPLVICFHGSGGSCASWQELASILSKSHRILLYDRGKLNPKPEAAITEMVAYLKSHNLGPPYILIAHSYGGAFAREFIQRFAVDVAGMILAETGQETVLDPKTEETQYRHQILGNKPLSVIRGNTIIRKYAQLEARSLKEGRDLREDPEYKLLEAWEKEDEKLKKRQLQLSTNTHYVHIPDASHELIRERPDAVAAEVEWVMANLCTGEPPRGVLSRLQAALRSLMQN